MAYKVFDDYNADYKTSAQEQRTVLNAHESERLTLPDESYVRDADMSRDGVDLVLETDHGTVVVEGYFSAEPTPNLFAPDGTALTPNLVESFTRGGNEYADAGYSTNDASPVGAVQEISGEATVTRLNGTVESVGIGTPIYPGDIVETNDEGAVNIMFIDETTFAISEDARLAIDEYVFDPATQSGTTNFSVLKGVFVFTSGLIGRDDPDDVMIDTPSGSIGIRGTIIAGDVDTGEITVIEGAIVLHDLSGNSITLANQYETARFNTVDNNIDYVGTLEANDVSSKFSSVSTVSANLFSSINDSANEGQETSQKTIVEDTKQANDTEAQEKQSTSSEATDSNSESSTQDDGATEAAPEGSAEEEQETDASLESSPNEAEFLTSGDILNPEGDFTQSAPKPPAPSTTTTSSSTTGPTSTSGTNPPPVIEVKDNTDAPPFTIDVTKFSFQENVTGATVARVTGDFTNFTNLSLAGTAVNYYDIERVTANEFIIKLKATVSINAESPYKLNILATNESGAATIIRDIDLNVIDVNEPLSYSSVSMPTSYFEVAKTSVFTYDFSKEFEDQDGLTGFTLTTAPVHPDIASYSFDNTTGILTLQMNSTLVNSGADINFTVQAQSNSGTLSRGYTIDVLDETTTLSTITTANDIYYGNDATIFVAANGVRIFANGDSADNTVYLNGNNGTAHTGAGNDTIDTAGATTGFQIFAGDGNDTINLESANGIAYGEGGNDQFWIDSAGAISDLQTTSLGYKINGGSGNDLLHLTNNAGGSIDFTAIDNTYIRNIEKIATINGVADTVTLSYQDVIAMTDENNVLKIDMDSNDTLNFINGSGNQFFHKGTESDGGEQYNIYTDGTITLMVDTDASNVSGIV